MKRSIIVIMISVWATTAFAQTQPMAFGSGQLAALLPEKQTLVEEAIKNALVIFHTQYQLQDTKEKAFYGAYGKEYFGETYSVGVKICDGYLTSNAAIEPWQEDNNFIKYRESEQYKPALSLAEYRELDADTYTNVSATFDPEKATAFGNNLYAFTDSLFGNKGLKTRVLEQLNDGWLVWVIADKVLAEDSAAKLTLVISRYELKTAKNNRIPTYDIVAPQTQKIVLGGIYVLPEATEIGELSFRLLGIMQEKVAGWELIPAVGKNAAPAAIRHKPQAKTQNAPVVKPTPVSAKTLEEQAQAAQAKADEAVEKAKTLKAAAAAAKKEEAAAAKNKKVK